MGGNSGSKNRNPEALTVGDDQNQRFNVANFESGNMTISGQQTIYMNSTVTYQQMLGFSKKIHHFPQQSQNFYGRQRVLNDLEKFVRSVQKLEADKMIIISGFGGMGKSEIAKVLAHKIMNQFDYIFWFNAQSRTTLGSGFLQLLNLLDVQLKEEDKTPFKMASRAYALLEEHFAKSIFIFDNAEFLLKSDPNSTFGLEEYLLPDLKRKKPVFIITTRNDWSIHQLKHKFMEIINLGELSKEEAKVCFLKYLRIEGLEIPLSLSTTIDKLVLIVQGHPLGISLMANEAADQERKISFGEVEERIKNYLELLQEKPLEQLTKQENYERNLQTIFDERMWKLLLEEETGRDAAEILSILSRLSPDNIFVGLVDGIFSRKIFYPQEYFCDRFLVGHSELRVRRALKLLESNSLIRIESVQIKYQGNFDMIRIHRLVQRSAGKSKSVLLQQTHTLHLISDFFATNEDNEYFGGHISLILTFQEEMKFPLENLDLLFLISEFIPRDIFRINKAEVVRLLSSRQWNAEENLVLSMIEILVNPKPKEERTEGEVKELFLRLQEELVRRGWILQLCTRVLHKFIDDFDGPDLRTLQSWLKQCYVECPSINRSFPELLKFVYKWNDWVVGTDDKQFVLKFFSNTSERERGWFWCALNQLNTKVFMGLVRHFFLGSGEISLFVKSLEFPTKELKNHFLKTWAEDFEGCVRKVVENEEMREKLLATEDFLRALKEITEFAVNEITREFHELLANGVSSLLVIWLELFSAHELTYKKFGDEIGFGLVMGLPESTRSQLSNFWTRRWEWMIIFNDLSLKLNRLEYCSKATKSWIQTLTPKWIMRTNRPKMNEKMRKIRAWWI